MSLEHPHPLLNSLTELGARIGVVNTVVTATVEILFIPQDSVQVRVLALVPQ